MSFSPTYQQQERLAETIERRRFRMPVRERLGELIATASFLSVAITVAMIAPPRHLDVAAAAICTALLVVATQVRFDTPLGYTVASQLAFVPLLFALPLALVAPAVVIALALARTPDVIRGKLRVTRLYSAVGNSWFALGPVAVFVIAGATPQHAAAALLALALLAQFAVDFTVSAMRFSIARSATLVEHLKTSWVYAIDAALSGVGLVVAEAIHRTALAPLALLPLLGLLAVFARERRTRLESLVELNNAYRGTALVLGNVVEADDGYTGEHCRGVVALCLAVADRLDLGAEHRRNLEFGALLHDVGKIAIPKEIINKPGKLDPNEWSIIRTHTIEGQRLLDTVGGFMRDVGLIVRSHHERWDGGGYPDGLLGEEIPLESRIVSACDTWNAMRTDRSYRQALPFELAEAELKNVSGSQLDPTVVAALLEVVESERERQPLAA